MVFGPGECLHHTSYQRLSTASYNVENVQPGDEIFCSTCEHSDGFHFIHTNKYGDNNVKYVIFVI